MDVWTEKLAPIHLQVGMNVEGRTRKSGLQVQNWERQYNSSSSKIQAENNVNTMKLGLDNFKHAQFMQNHDVIPNINQMCQFEFSKN